MKEGTKDKCGGHKYRYGPEMPTEMPTAVACVTLILSPLSAEGTHTGNVPKRQAPWGNTHFL